MKVKELAKEYKQYVIDIRREIHRHPEPGTQEFVTAALIRRELDAMGIPYVVKFNTGTVATITGNKPGKTIALRADIDALTLDDRTGCEYASEVPGMNHACGHDTHAAMLLGAAKILKEMKDEINGTVKLFFQPAEEVGIGARGMIADGCMEGVDSVFAIHIASGVDTGKVGSGAGGRMASADRFIINVTGKGGHGAAPHECVDAVYVASKIVVALQEIVSREIGPTVPAVVTCGTINGGARWNIVANEAVIEGTTRCLSAEVRNQLEEAIGRIAQGIATAYRATAELDYQRLVAPTVNTAASVDICEETVKQLMGDNAYFESPITMGGEDAGEYFEVAPEGGCLANLGAHNENKPETFFPHHHPQFNVDEDAFELGSALYAQYAINYLNK
ncbi:MAG: amidohydrolase [Oscillospiraceae bacterium]|nr:amidohydrolase [Oscillospiraceae bacterium]